MVQKSLGSAVLAIWMAGQTAASGPTVLAIDSAQSRVVIDVGKAGVFSFAGHIHEVVSSAVGGRVTFDPADWSRASVSLDFDAAALRVSGKGESAADVPEVQRVMLSDKVLDIARFPKITFKSRKVSAKALTASSADVLIEGDMTLHGTTRPMAIRAAVTLDSGGGVTARGSFSLKQTEFGMVPVTAGGGAVRVKDELAIQFVLKAVSSRETSARH